MTPFPLRILSPLLLLALAAPALAQQWTITTADLQPRSGSLQAIDSTSVRLATGMGDASAVIPLNQFVSATRQSAAAVPGGDEFLLVLADGQRLAGRPRTVLQDKLAWTSPTLGEVILPLARLRGMVSAAEFAAGEAATIAQSPPPRQDLVSLRNGDSVSGVFTACSNNTVTIQTDAGSSDVPLSAVSRILFAAAGAPAPAESPTTRPATHHDLVGLSDGSLVSATNVTLADARLDFDFAAAARRVALDQVQRIEQVDGPVSWLSSRQPVEQIDAPFFGAPAAAWPARFDSAVDGGPILAGGRRFDRGIGVHAYSRLTFAIEPGWSTFRTQFAADRGPEQDYRLADMTVRILLNGTVAYHHDHVRDGALSDVVTVPLNGATRLTLECDYGTGGDVQDRLNWIQPALVRSGATTAP